LGHVRVTLRVLPWGPVTWRSTVKLSPLLVILRSRRIVDPDGNVVVLE